MNLVWRSTLALGLTLSINYADSDLIANTVSKSLAAKSPKDTSNAFPYRELSDAETRTVAARIGYISGEPHPDNGKCIGCHSEFNEPDRLDHYFDKTIRAYICFDDYTTKLRSSNEILQCLANLKKKDGQVNQDILQIGPQDLGFMAAGVNHTVFHEIFKQAAREADYETFKRHSMMPPGNHPFQDGDFELLLSWVLAYYPNLEEFVRVDGPNICQESGDGFIGPAIRNYVRSMNEGGLNWWLANQARGINMFACPSQDSFECFTQRRQGLDIFPAMDNWKYPNRLGKIRILHEYSKATNYWIRTSADGRFVANGGSPSAIIDLQSKLLTGRTRRITVDAQYDPGFFPDNSGFLFQATPQGSSVCEQSVLFDTNLSHINFNQDGCTANDLNIGLYQSIGSSLNTGDIKTIAGEFGSDDGYSKNRDSIPLFMENASIQLDTVRRISKGQFEKISSQDLATPYHGNWMSSPANRLAIANLTASQDHHAKRGGYRLFLIDDAFASDGKLPSFGDDSTAQICSNTGEKPNFSFDERFVVWYRYTSQDDRVESENSSADLWLFDLLEGTEPMQLTQMPKGYYAQFPHFRSDGWLYFSVYNALENTRSVAATDMMLYIKERGIK